MTNTKSDKFEADYWRDNFQLLLEAVEKSDHRMLDKIKTFSKRVNTKRVTDRKDKSLAADLNNVTRGLSQKCWDLFLKKVRDERYEKDKVRIRISIVNFNRMKQIIQEHTFNSPDDFIEAILDHFTEAKLKKLKKKHRSEI